MPSSRFSHGILGRACNIPEQKPLPSPCLEPDVVVQRPATLCRTFQGAVLPYLVLRSGAAFWSRSPEPPGRRGVRPHSRGSQPAVWTNLPHSRVIRHDSTTLVGAVREPPLQLGSVRAERFCLTSLIRLAEPLLASPRGRPLRPAECPERGAAPAGVAPGSGAPPARCPAGSRSACGPAGPLPPC